ncbi:metaxin-1 isoform X2 [Leptopilina boulardi]|uniref:metaxin-1 isoform X2 n=1 Tax=Leptopilina boulardi TaxID=63433 RepID=UPI0021F5E91B|nr:metaxin-1 isoform X2 [Leptopilina boulardi]
MKTVETYQLDVWKGDWGLPSIDINCLQALAYAKFCKIPLKINATNNPYRSPNGQLPVLRHQYGIDYTIRNILQFFRKNNYCLDFGLSPKQCADVNAYETMLKEELFPALQFIWWVDERNFRQVIRPWYGKAMPYFLNYYYPSKYEKEAKTLMESLYPTEDEISNIETDVYGKAQKCLTLLSNRLGDKDYFFGSKPTTLDAIIFSYLAPILRIPLLNNALKNHLTACVNLEDFVVRISVKYFENDYRLYEKEIKMKNTSEPNKTEEEIDFPHKSRNKILAGVFATVAMLGFAIFSGILEVVAYLIRHRKFLRIPKKARKRASK